ncbi:GTPase domain-containing protein [Bradyrhizobium betae]
MGDKLHERVLRYVRAEQPLGPADAHQIDDPEVAALLFDPHNTSFNTLLKKDISLVIGRRGSGKTALLNSYLYKPFFDTSILDAANDAKLDVGDYKIVIPISKPQAFRANAGPCRWFKRLVASH